MLRQPNGATSFQGASSWLLTSMPRVTAISARSRSDSVITGSDSNSALRSEVGWRRWQGFGLENRDQRITVGHHSGDVATSQIPGELRAGSRATLGAWLMTWRSIGS
jgi:hypothetical protein